MFGAWNFVKRELTLCIALCAAAASCFFVTPDRAYLAYFDLRVLALLYALMVVVSGLRGAGVFDALANILCRRAKTVRAMGLTLVALCFFSSLLITNDVAILTFVPLAVMVLRLARQERALAWVVVLQIAAANLGSMLTPVGNPQNLYLYSFYGMSARSFFSATGPVWLVSAALMALLCLALPNQALEPMTEPTPNVQKTPLCVYTALLMVCLLVVFRVIPWPCMLAAVGLTLVCYDKRALLRADFCLLLTFVCFFVFSGNLARIPAVHALIKPLLAGHERVAAAAVSQVISNVPAAVLLSGFTDRARALLIGVNIGGLGTPVASLASLIGMKLFFAQEQTQSKRFILLFALVNAGLLTILLLVCGLFA